MNVRVIGLILRAAVFLSTVGGDEYLTSLLCNLNLRILTMQRNTRFKYPLIETGMNLITSNLLIDSIGSYAF